MARVLLQWFPVCLFAANVLGEVILSLQSSSNHEFQLKCTLTWFDKLASTYWFRSGELILVINYRVLWSSTHEYKKNGFDLKNRTEIDISGTTHIIKIKVDGRDKNAYWKCCRKFFKYKCSHNELVKVRSDGTEMTVPIPTYAPETDMPDYLNETLTLQMSHETRVVGERLRMSCSSDTEISGDEWLIHWFRNDTVVFITNGSAAVITAGENNDPRSSNDSQTTDISEPSGYMFQDLRVSSDEFSQNVTFLVSSFLIGWSYWNCGNPNIANLSNALFTNVTNVTTPVTTKASVTMTMVSNQEKSTRFAETSSLGPTTPTAEKLGDNASPTTTIVAGSISGVVIIAVLLIVILAVFRWRKRKRNYGANSCNTDTFKENIVMEDNVLYAGSRDSNQEKSGDDDERVMEDNVLYAGSKDINQEKSGYDDERVMQDNILYGGGKDYIHDNMVCQDDEAAVMEDNVLYGRSNCDFKS